MRPQDRIAASHPSDLGTVIQFPARSCQWHQARPVSHWAGAGHTHKWRNRGPELGRRKQARPRGPWLLPCRPSLAQGVRPSKALSPWGTTSAGQVLAADAEARDLLGREGPAGSCPELGQPLPQSTSQRGLHWQRQAQGLHVAHPAPVATVEQGQRRVWGEAQPSRSGPLLGVGPWAPPTSFPGALPATALSLGVPSGHGGHHSSLCPQLLGGPSCKTRGWGDRGQH